MEEKEEVGGRDSGEGRGEVRGLLSDQGIRNMSSVRDHQKSETNWKVRMSQVQTILPLPKILLFVTKYDG